MHFIMIEYTTSFVYTWGRDTTAFRTGHLQSLEEGDLGVKGIVIHCHRVSNFLVYQSSSTCIPLVAPSLSIIIVNHDATVYFCGS